MRQHVNCKFGHLGIALYVLISGVQGCANLSSTSSVPEPTVDQNAIELIERIKNTPSRMSGGGMIYELFVGGHFNAKFDQREGELTLADIETDYACRYGADGLLRMPGEATNSHISFCTQLIANTTALLTK